MVDTGEAHSGQLPVNHLHTAWRNRCLTKPSDVGAMDQSHRGRTASVNGDAACQSDVVSSGGEDARQGCTHRNLFWGLSHHAQRRLICRVRQRTRQKLTKQVALDTLRLKLSLRSEPEDALGDIRRGSILLTNKGRAGKNFV